MDAGMPVFAVGVMPRRGWRRSRLPGRNGLAGAEVRMSGRRTRTLAQAKAGEACSSDSRAT